MALIIAIVCQIGALIMLAYNYTFTEVILTNILAVLWIVVWKMEENARESK